MTDHFGACPVCGDSDGFLNIGPGHWFYCTAHRVRWFVGSNLFDAWRHETEQEQRRAYDALDFGRYTDARALTSPSAATVH